LYSPFTFIDSLYINFHGCVNIFPEKEQNIVCGKNEPFKPQICRYICSITKEKTQIICKNVFLLR